MFLNGIQFFEKSSFYIRKTNRNIIRKYFHKRIHNFIERSERPADKKSDYLWRPDRSRAEMGSLTISRINLRTQFLDITC